MPFTISHAAVAWPLRNLSRQHLITPALVLGSMAPDAEYLLRLRPSGKFGHSLPGLFVFCVPVGILSLWIWERLVARQLYFLVVPPAASRMCEPQLSSHALPRIALSVLVAAGSHICWDHFTHDW